MGNQRLASGLFTESKKDFRQRCLDGGFWDQVVQLREQFRKALHEEGVERREASSLAWAHVMRKWPKGSECEVPDTDSLAASMSLKVDEGVPGPARPVRDGPVELSEDELRALSALPDRADYTTVVEWIMAHAEDLRPSPRGMKCPSRSAWNWLMAIRSSAKVQSDFYSQHVKQLAPARRQDGELERFRDDGRVVRILNEVRQAQRKADLWRLVIGELRSPLIVEGERGRLQLPAGTVIEVCSDSPWQELGGSSSAPVEDCVLSESVA